MEEVATPTEAGELDQGTAPPPTLETLNQAFPELDVHSLIGQGGMGAVFKVTQSNMNRTVALKVLPEVLAKKPEFTERFTREARVLAKLNHPNIVTLYDFGERNGIYFLIMDYIDGVNLRQAMKIGRFSPQQALKVVPKIWEALDYAHSQDVLHRDIKPANVLLDTKGTVKLADFGIAKLGGKLRPDITLTNTGGSLGTPQYMA
ncbi:MAG TPA: serine/threonine protein kinase, partial [Verrucomicrobiales bacterium]|nr:serine/threonine protein kinase [Verrucomicrobiales bacterium]